MKNKVCIYCGKPANSKDHIPSKCILEKPYPNNLKTVPCCIDCNFSFSNDEQYFLILLSYISSNSMISDRLKPDGLIGKTLRTMPELQKRLDNALQRDEEGNNVIEPEMGRVKMVIKKTSLGLYYNRYKRIIPFNLIDKIEACPYEHIPNKIFIATFTERFNRKKWKCVQKNVFEYIFVNHPENKNSVLCIMNFYNSLWGFVELPKYRKWNIGNRKQYWLM